MLGLALGVGGVVSGLFGRRSAAKDANKFQREQAAAIARAARESYLRGVNQIGNRLGQERASASAGLLSRQSEQRTQTSAIESSLAERGVTGGSIEALLDDFERIEIGDAFNVATNLEWAERQAAEDILSLHAQAQNQVASATPTPIRMPSLLGPVLEIGTRAVDWFDRRIDRQPR